MILSAQENTLHFSSLRRSHAGRYSCNVTVKQIMYRDFEDIVLISRLSTNKNANQLQITFVL